MPETLYLIDGHALAYRTYFALTGAGTNTARWLTTKGEPTAGIFGFASVLLRILEQDRPDYLAVAFDTGKTFRDEIFPDYKGTREKMPDDLRSQIERMRELVDKFNIPRLEINGYEADDVLGSVSTSIAETGLGVKIITGDKDLLQLVTERIVVSLPGRKLSEAKDYLPKDVFESLGVRPDQVVDYKALVGDKSDNIPGVRGIGVKTASALLGEYETLGGVYENIDKLKPAQQKKLIEDKSNAELSKKLAQIVTDLDIPLDLEQARIKNFEPSEVKELFRELEFRNLMNRLNDVMGIIGMEVSDEVSAGEQIKMFGREKQESNFAQSSDDTEVILVDTQNALALLVEELNAAEVIAFDTETTSTDKMQADLVGISLAVEPQKGYYIPLGHKEGVQLKIENVIEALRKPLTNKKIPKVAHNIKYDYVMLARYGLEVTPFGFDTMIAEWLRDPDSRNLGLKNLAWVRLNIEMTEISTLIGKGKKQITMAEVPIEQATPYAVADAEVVLRLMPLLEQDLKDCEGEELFYNLELPLIQILSKMEIEGISLDVDFLGSMSKKLDVSIDEIKIKVFERVGEEFNLNSTQQLSNALFSTLGLVPPDGTKKNASGHYSTAASVLDALIDDDPIIELILGYRELAKLKSTYVDALPAQVNDVTKRVHTSYSQTGSVTGRLASTNPNLQNIPIRTELGRKVREAFVSGKNRTLLSVDYSQVELRIAAHMANDKTMIQAFKDDQDIHAATAAAIYEISLDDVTKDQRRHAKAINFGLIYGMSPFGLTRTTNLTLAEAENFVTAYFNQFQGIKNLLDELKEMAIKQEFVETLMGRKRYFKGLGSQQNQFIKNRQLREAINAPIQGTAADIMKLAMLKVSATLGKNKMKSKMLLQVHDEIVLECPSDELDEVVSLVMKDMSTAYELNVPLKTEARMGINWGKMNDIER